MRRGYVSFLLVASVAAFCAPAGAQGLQSLETQDLRLLYFDPSQTYLVPHAARSFENSLRSQRKIFDYDPFEKVTVLLKDFSDYGNAGALPVPRNAVIVDIAPRALTFETAAPTERLYTWMNHELVHLVTTEQTTAADRRLRKFFSGKVQAISDHPETMFYQYLTTPRLASPRWYHEGMAVFMQTWMAGGLGRAQGGYDEMVFRSMVRDDSHFYDPLGLVSSGTMVDFQVGVNAYLYGTRFLSYLAYTYSPDKLVSWVTRTEGSKRYYASQFKLVFGLPLDEAWQDWIDWEHEFQKANLVSVGQFPVTPYTDLSTRPLGSVSRAFLDPVTNKMYAAFRYPGAVAHIGAISLDDGSVEKIIDIKGPMLFRVTSLAHDPKSGTLFYTADNFAYRDLMSVNPRTGESKMLLKDARIGELVFNKTDRSIWGTRHLNGVVTLVRIPYPYDEWNQIHTFPYGTMLYDMDVSPDGTLLSTSFSNLEGEHSIQILKIESLLAGEIEPLQKFDQGTSVPESYVFSPDGKFLFGSAYYTGVSNIFRYEIDTGDVEAVSNAETGFFRPLPREDGSLIIFHYTGQGFVPASIDPVPLEDVGAITFLGQQIIRKHPELRDWQAGSPADIPLDELVTDEGEYTPVSNFGLESMYPIILGYKDSVSLGLRANFSDPIQLDSLSIAASYNVDGGVPSDERLNVNIEYRHAVVSSSPFAGTWRFGARRNYADFYDLFGPTKMSRKGNRFFVGFEKTLLYDEPRRLEFKTELNHYSDMDALPRYQNVPVTFDKLTTFGAILEYTHVRKSLGAVDDEKGFTWRLGATADHVDGDTIPKILGEFDFGFALPWRHSSIWLRNAAGIAFGDEFDEFANFFFGGFGNNYVDHGEIKRYREYYAMPGFELNAVPGRNFHRAMLEWNLPPIRFERIGTAGFYLSWARPALFATYLTTNLDSTVIQQNTNNYGIQVDFQFTVLSRLNMTLSTGYAKAYGNNSFTDEEWMVSLKIM
jgi:hypothetical protein